MRWGVVAMIASACGRISFDPPGTSSASSDGAMGDSPAIDAAPGTQVLTPTQDAYIQNSTPPHGTENGWIVGRSTGAGNEQRTLVRFDLTGVPVNVQTATFRGYMGAGSGSVGLSVSVYRMTTTWDEATVTWNESATGMSWTPGGVFDPGPYAATTLQLTTVGYYDWDITTLVNEWTSSAHPNFGFALAQTTQPPVGTDGIFDSREHPNPAVRPQLLITP